MLGESVEDCAARVAGEVARLLEGATVRDRTTGVGRQATPGDIAILFRSRQTHREFQAALESRGIPAFVYKGLGFFDADEIKDYRALLRYLADPTSELRTAALLRSRLVRITDAALAGLAEDVPALPHARYRLVAATLATLVMGLIWTAAFAIMALGTLNLISVAFAVLFIGLSVDFGIHYGLRYQETMDEGEDHARALGEAAKRTGGALTLCAVSAAIGLSRTSMLALRIRLSNRSSGPSNASRKTRSASGGI